MLVHTCTSLKDMHLSYIDNTQNTALVNSKNPYTQDITYINARQKWWLCLNEDEAGHEEVHEGN